LTSSFWPWVWGYFSLARFMRASATDSRSRPMAEAFIGLLVAIGLGGYLLYALLHPEKF
jgi:K+-transporting ATPase KdpF subunit